MRHNKSSRRFSRESAQLKAMFSNMTSDLITHGRIQTTVQKAKELRKYAERMITLGKSGDVSSRRRAMAYMGSKSAVTRLFDEIAPIYKERNGGYTRIIKVGVRPGDAATMAIIELVEEEFTPKPSNKPKKTAKVEKKVDAKEEVSAEPKTEPEAPVDAETTEEAPVEAKPETPVEAPAEETKEAPAEEAPKEEVKAEPETKEEAPVEEAKEAAPAEQAPAEEKDADKTEGKDNDKDK